MMISSKIIFGSCWGTINAEGDDRDGVGDNKKAKVLDEDSEIAMRSDKRDIRF